MLKQPILFFADKLPPLIGGMEMHAHYFIQHFKNHPNYKLEGVITKNTHGNDHLVTENENKEIKISDLGDLFQPRILFFNSGRWIEELEILSTIFRKSKFIYRTGGNEIIKATLYDHANLDHISRQQYWSKKINKHINLIVTNSQFTERRLSNIGITTPFFRCVGGANINTGQNKSMDQINNSKITMLCAARFVPYKNHSLLINVIQVLKKRGHDITLSLAGDGPLLPSIKELVKKMNLDSSIRFLGRLDNTDVSKEMTQSDIYIQLSSDHLTPVDQGSYLHCEGMGRSILEAISTGTFVIAGNSGALPEIIYGDRGILVDIDAPLKIADKIEPFLKKRISLDQITEYSWENLFSRYELMMKKVLSQ